MTTRTRVQGATYLLPDHLSESPLRHAWDKPNSWPSDRFYLARKEELEPHSAESLLLSGLLRTPEAVSRRIQAKVVSLEALVEELADLLLSRENEEFYLALLRPDEIPAASPYKLLAPIHVVVRPAKGEVWASALGMSGQGASEAESKADLLSMLMDEMKFLRQNWNELGATRRRRLDRLGSILEPR